MDYNVRLSSSEEIFRTLLIDEYRVEKRKVDVLIKDCQSSLESRPPSPPYDVVFHKVVRDVLDSHKENYTHVC